MPRTRKTSLAFVPYTPVPEAYAADDVLNLETLMLQAFEHLFGFSSGALPTSFKRFLNQLMCDNHPDLRCSSLRAVFEGRIPDVPRPISDIPITLQGRFKMIMLFMDVMETIIAEYMEDKMSLTEHAKLGIPSKGHKRSKPKGGV